MDENNQFAAVEYVRGEIVYVEREAISPGDTTKKTRLWIILNPTLGHGELFAVPITSQPSNGIIPIFVNEKNMWIAPAIRNIHVQNIIRHVAFVSPQVIEELNMLLMWTIGLSDTVTDAMRRGQIAYEALCKQKDDDPNRDVWFNTLGTSKNATNSQIVKKIRDTKLGEPYYQEDIRHLRNGSTDNNSSGSKEKLPRSNAIKRAPEKMHKTQSHSDDTKVHIKLFNSFMLNEFHAKAVLSGKYENAVQLMLGYKSKTWYARLKQKIYAHPNGAYPPIQYIKAVSEDKVTMASNPGNASDAAWQLFVNAFAFIQKNITISDDPDQSCHKYTIVFGREHLMLMSTFGCMLVLDMFGLKGIGSHSKEDLINIIANRIAELT